MRPSRSSVHLFCVFLILAFVPVSGMAVVYVDGGNSTGPWDGNSWASAYRTVQEGLDDAQKSGEEVWVAKGTYRPTTSEDRTVAITLRSGVALYGGFEGTETKLEQRDWKKHVTILSGDIGQKNNDSDNSTHVVMGADDAIIDGFTITGGNGIQRGRQGPPGQNRQPPSGRQAPGASRPPGEGLAIEGHGGALLLQRPGGGSSPEGRGGSPPQRPGGGQQPGGRGGPIHITPDIIMQGPGPHGAGMINYQCAPTIRNCTFKNNRAGKGGAMYNMVSKQSGRGRLGSGEPAPLIEGCTFVDNYAIGRGGAVSNDLGTDPTFIGCTFINNSTGGKGGAMYNDFGCSPTIVNSLFVGNSAQSGGAIGNDGGSSPTITNCTFSKNRADDLGAALYQGSGSANNPIVTNSILWGNEVPAGPAEIYAWHESNPVVTYSCVEGGYSGQGNISLNPRFIDASNGDYRLAPGSPCIDAGNGSITYPVDRDGSSRFDDKGIPNGFAAVPSVGPRGPAGQTGQSAPVRAPVDVGAYERQEDTKLPARSTVFVASGTRQGRHDGKSWATALTSIQEALDLAYATGAEVWVAKGVYKTASSGDRKVSIQLRKNVSMYGGFQGIETKREQRDWVNNLTVLSGDIGIPNDIRDNSYHVLIGEDDTVLDGFTITGGNADGVIFNAKGGGMVNYRPGPSRGQGPRNANVSGFSPSISNCIFTKNHAVDGGAIYNFDRGTPKLTDCTFVENTAQNGGAIVDRVGVKSTLTNCTFTKNQAKWRGGAFYVDYGSRPQVINCSFSENSTDGYGGAVYTISRASQLEHTVVNIKDSRFDGNTAKWRGGGIAIYDSSVLDVSSSSFANNRAEKGGGGLSNDYLSVATLTGCSFDGNRSVEGEQDIDTADDSEVKVSE